MRTSLLILLVALATVAVLPPGAARAADIVGIADQSPEMFNSRYYEQLDVRVSRLIVSYDAVLEGTFEVPQIDAWMATAFRANVQPLVSFNHARGCYVDGKPLRSRRCRLPSVQRFREAFRAFRQRYSALSVYSPWNEANHISQPTAKNPERAAQFYNVVREDCRGCTIVAADVLDQGGMVRWLRAFKRHAKGKPRLWGLHNYKDVNDFGTRGTRAMLRAVRGEIWLTETGGIVRFGSRPFSTRRAARATRFMFELAASSKRIKRLFIYQWFGQPRSARFDAGLMTVKGEPRQAYKVVRNRLRRPGGNPKPPPAEPPPPAQPPSEPPPPPPPPPEDPPEEPVCIIAPDICLPGPLGRASLGRSSQLSR